MFVPVFFINVVPDWDPDTDHVACSAPRATWGMQIETQKGPKRVPLLHPSSPSTTQSTIRSAPSTSPPPTVTRYSTVCTPSSTPGKYPEEPHGWYLPGWALHLRHASQWSLAIGSKAGRHLSGCNLRVETGQWGALSLRQRFFHGTGLAEPIPCEIRVTAGTARSQQYEERNFESPRGTEPTSTSPQPTKL